MGQGHYQFNLGSKSENGISLNIAYFCINFYLKIHLFQNILVYNAIPAISAALFQALINHGMHNTLVGNTAVRSSPRKKKLTNSKPLSLTPEVWRKNVTVVSVRQQLSRCSASVYQEKTLRQFLLMLRGYHIECYRSFTSLHKQNVRSLTIDDSDVIPSTTVPYHKLKSVHALGVLSC